MDNIRKTTSSEPSSYKSEIDRYAPKTINGAHPFAGHRISWTSLGDTRWEQFKNYIISCVSPTYADAVREAFWDTVKADVSALGGWYQVQKGKSEDEINKFVHSVGKAQKEIMESPDLTEAQKMELILEATGSGTEKILKETIIGGQTTAKQDTEKLKNLLKDAGYNYADTATKYFEGKKETVLLLLSLVTKEATGTGDIYSRFQQEKITTVEDLKTFTAKVIQAIITEECGKDQTKLNKLENEVIKFLEEMPLSNKDKEALIWLARGPRLKLESMNAIDNMALITVEKRSDKDMVATMLQNLKEPENQMFFEKLDEEIIEPTSSSEPVQIGKAAHFENDKIQKQAVEIEVKSASDIAQFQEAYLKEVIETMIKQYGDNAQNLSKLKHNVNELLTSEASINITTEGKERLLNLFNIPMAYAENIKIMHDSLLTEDLWAEKQADFVNQANAAWKDMVKTGEKITEPKDQFFKRFVGEPGLHTKLAEILNAHKYIPDSMDYANKLTFDCLLALVKEINKPGNTPAAIAIAKENINKLVADPRLNFSEKQKLEIKRELIIGNPDKDNHKAEMKALLKSIDERKDIPLEKKMGLILIAIGDNAEFKEIRPENISISYSETANKFFSEMKLINKNALVEIPINLQTFFFNQLDSENNTLSSTAQSAYKEILRNNEIMKFRISPKANETSSSQAVRETRMNLIKDIFTKIMAAASNRTDTALVLKDYLQKLTKDIENSPYPLTTKEISELKATIDQLTQGSA